MKPHRVMMTHNLAINYGLDKKMDILVSLAESSERRGELKKAAL